MKINHALRPDGRWDTWAQSRLRSTQRTLRDDTLDQVLDMYDSPWPVESQEGDSWLERQLDDESWLVFGHDEQQNWLDYLATKGN